MESSSVWFAIVVTPSDPELSSEAFDELCYRLVEAGASGTAVDEAPRITCFLEGDQAKATQFIAQLSQLGCEYISRSELAPENWSASCPDLWEPIEIGAMRVVPVESPEDKRPVPPNAIKIIPGLGFGTGHHATTRMILRELHHLATQDPARSYTILDIGTGSGILAIAAARLFGVTVEAFDVDPLAIENAIDNVNLNAVQDLVQLSTKTLDQVSGTFDLILANVYGEVLINLARDITARSRPGTIALLSGITEIVWDQVASTYTALGWTVRSEQSEGDWLCARIELPA
jgi:ribosomal protein L11 methyltransferase